MKRKLLVLAALVFVFSFSASAQTERVGSVIHFLHKINSKILNEERTILVRVPNNYEQTSEKFPVVYMLIEQQSWGGQMPEMIVVGIQNTNRSRDLTPTDDGKGGRVGGGEKFMQFIEQEVIPMVEKNYRTQPFRIFAGHSLGGLMAVYSFVSRPDLFNAYIAASPVLGYDNDYVIKRAEELFKQNKDWKKTMFIGLGDEQQYQKAFNSFRDLLKKTNPKGFDYEFREFKEDNHGSVVLPAYYAGLRKIFSGWTPPQTGSVSELENHYKKLSKRFDYEILIPENTLNQIGYQFLQMKQFVEAIDVFKKNTQNYPNSANVYDSLAEAYEKNGQFKQARENYEKAYKLAESQGDTRLAEISKASLERVSGKIK